MQKYNPSCGGEKIQSQACWRQCVSNNKKSGLNEQKLIFSLVDQFSPIAWSLTYEIHWYDTLASHSGVATTARRVKEFAYVVGIKETAEIFRKSCGKC